MLQTFSLVPICQFPFFHRFNAMHTMTTVRPRSNHLGATSDLIPFIYRQLNEHNGITMHRIAFDEYGMYVVFVLHKLHCALLSAFYFTLSRLCFFDTPRTHCTVIIIPTLRSKRERELKFASSLWQRAIRKRDL